MYIAKVDCLIKHRASIAVTKISDHEPTWQPIAIDLANEMNFGDHIDQFLHTAMTSSNPNYKNPDISKVALFNEQKPKTDLLEQISVFSRKYPDTRMFSDLLISKYPEWMQQAYKEHTVGCDSFEQAAPSTQECSAVPTLQASETQTRLGRHINQLGA